MTGTMQRQLRIYIISTHVSLAGLLYGLDTGCVGPITSMDQFHQDFGVLSTGVKGIFISVFLIAAAIASLANAAISDRISRKWTIFLGASVCALATVISASSSTLVQLFIGRIGFGIGTGLAFSCCLNYIVEIAPSELRGQLSCFIQLFVALGAMAGYFFTYLTLHIDGSFAWRTPLITQGVIALILMAGIPFVPYSPRWLLSKGRHEEAFEVMQYLRGTHDAGIIRTEIQEMQAIIAAEARNSASYKEVFSKSLRRRSLLTIFLMVVQQASGIDAILYFAPTIFKSAGLRSQSSAFLASAITGIVLVLASLPGFFCDRIGRKLPTVAGGAAMALAMLVMGVCFSIGGHSKDGEISLDGKGLQWTVVAMVYVFVAAFEATWAVVLRTYCCEIIPTRQRARAASLQQYSNWIANFCIAISAPSFLKVSASGPYYFYGVCCLIGVIVSAIYMKESKGISLEKMDDLFTSKTSLIKTTVKSSAIELTSCSDMTRPRM